MDKVPNLNIEKYFTVFLRLFVLIDLRILAIVSAKKLSTTVTAMEMNAKTRRVRHDFKGRCNSIVIGSI